MIPNVILNQVPDITFETGAEAEAVLDRMKDVLKAYDVVVVADYRMLANVSVTHIDYKYGWTDLDEARIVYSRGEFMIDFPLASSIPTSSI